MRLILEDPRLEATVEALNRRQGRLTITYPREDQYLRPVRAALRAMLKLGPSDPVATRPQRPGARSVSLTPPAPKACSRSDPEGRCCAGQGGAACA